MGRLSRIVKPQVDRGPISDGDWIEIKRTLNTGENKALDVCGSRPMIVEGRLFSPIDWRLHDLERAMIFLTAWSLRNEDDKPLDLNIDTLKSLDTETFDEINAAIFN